MPRAILRPSAASFRASGWLPASQAHFDKYIKHITTKLRTPLPLLPAIREFKDFIETDPTVYAEFIRMFEGASESPKNYLELLNMFNIIFREAPPYGSLGPPMYMIMAQNMNTQGGFSAYTKEKLNYHFKKMFETWALFLTSQDSRSVLTETSGGWFSPVAKRALLKAFGQDRLFEQVFICNPRAEFYGFTSFADFFNRRLADPNTDRPTGPIDNLGVISAACESTAYAYEEGIKETDQFFVKDQAYSLIHLLANDPYVKAFIGGTILQGFLSTTGYHRWHAPVNGVIKKIVNVPGTYFAQAPCTISDPIPPAESEMLPPYLNSLRFFANTAARQLIFIQADNPQIGLICFIPIGMTEISTCQATVYEGQHVNRGNELGMFHFGGSSWAMLFRKKAKVYIAPRYREPGTSLPINKVIGGVSKPRNINKGGPTGKL